MFRNLNILKLDFTYNQKYGNIYIYRKRGDKYET